MPTTAQIPASSRSDRRRRNRPRFALALALFCADGAALASGDEVEKAASRPNILLLLADDLGNNDFAFDVGSNRNRNNDSDDSSKRNEAELHTPNMDALARAGTRFTRFYTESTCTPSRVALLTGRYAARAGFRPASRGIPPDLTTLPEALRAQGYATHHVGKWHVGSTVRAAWPLAQGFDTSFGFLDQWSMRKPKGAHSPSFPTYHDPWLQTDNQPRELVKGHLTDLLTDRTVELIAAADKSKPWFIYHAFFAPHAPIQPSEHFAKMYPDTGAGKFRALLRQLDSSVGRIMESLRMSGQLGNTIVIFASDNGGTNKFRDNNAPYFGNKNSYWEGGVRVPLVILWPNGFQPGTRIDEPVAIFDLYPTLLDLIDSRDVPDNLDGISLEQAQTQKQLLDRDLFWEANPFSRLVYGVLTRDNMRLYHELGGASHLLDLERNPHGERDGAIADSIQVDAVRTRYMEWRNQVRRVETQWTQHSENGRGVLTGDDFQRSPGMASFTFAIAITPAIRTAGEPSLQWIAHQHDLFTIALDPLDRVRVEVDGEVLESKPLRMGECHSIIFSGSFSRRLSPSAVFNSQVSVLNLFVDGELADLDSSERPLPSVTPLDTPTFIGSDRDGKQRFDGHLGRPEILNQALMLKDSDSSPGIGKLDASLCAPKSK